MIAASVEQGHTLISGSCLQLLEISTWIGTLGATLVRRIYAFPRGFLVDDNRLLQLLIKKGTRSDRAFYLINVRTCATSKPIACWIFLKPEKIGAIWAK